MSLLLVASAHPAAAYTQDKQLEAALGRSDHHALALLPAKGFKDGAAGFFRTHELRVVPGTERAWCATQPRAVLKPGCYVEFFVQGKGQKAANARGEPCGLIARWYKAPGTSTYVPTPGPFLSRAIADGNDELVEATIYDEGRPACR